MGSRGVNLANVRRPEKVRWLANALTPDVMTVEEVGSGWPALAQVRVGPAWQPVALHVSLLIDSGEGRDDPDECRIEPPPRRSIQAPDGRLPLVIGVLPGDPTPRTVVIWDGRPRAGLATRGSLYSKWSAVRMAADKNWFEHLNTNGERVVAAAVDLIPTYVGSITGATVPTTVQPRGTTGIPYKPRMRRPRVTAMDPFRVDPEKIERGVQAHEDTIEQLDAFLRKHGIQTVTPGSDQPAYDLAWSVGNTLFVAEVKSVTDENEDKQLRLGLGQALWYRHLLAKRQRPARAVLVPEREPRDRRWQKVCSECEVLLIWPPRFDPLLDSMKS